MDELLIVVDMQHDFIDGSLGTTQAQAILPKVRNKIENFKGNIIFTRDTHQKNYLTSQEGKNLPIEHCIEGTKGWQIHDQLSDLVSNYIVDKITFGSSALPQYILSNIKKPTKITLIGLCTDICVISNALLLKAFFPEIVIVVDASCCAGVTNESHLTALKAMQACQIQIME